MVCRKNSLILTSVCALALACGPDEATGGGGSGSSSGSGGRDTSVGSATVPPSTMTAASNSGDSSSGTPTPADTADTDPPEDSSDVTTDPPTSSESGDCVPGAENCLCDIGAACDDDLACNDKGVCVAPPSCERIEKEDHEGEDSATPFDELNCDEGADLGVVATLFGPETDWFTFFGNNAQFCPEQPTAIVTADEPLNVCVYIECASGEDVQFVACSDESRDAVSPDGRDGCCGTDQAEITAYDCAGFGGKDVDVFVSVGSEEEICVDYGLEISI